ncbi:hypothetical protein [Microbacterium sp. NPDC089695]
MDFETTVEKIPGLAMASGAVSPVADGLAASTIVSDLLPVRRRRA